MTLGGTRAEWSKLLHRVASNVNKGESAEAVIAITEQLFDVPQPEPWGRPLKVTKRKLAKIFVKMAAGKTDVAETVCPSNGIDQRTLWRYFDEVSLPGFQRQLRIVWHTMFLMGVRRFGLMRLGYEVYIDEHQVPIFIKNRCKIIHADGKDILECNQDGGEGSELGLVATPPKKDKYSGKFQAMMYQCMVARFTKSGVMLPLDLVLVAKQGSVLPDGSEVPWLSKEWIIDHFIGVLEALYPPPRLIMFDRGYHANQNYARVEAYCRRHACRYLTPAVRQPSDAFDAGDGVVYASIEDFVRRNLVNAKPVTPGSNVYYFIGKKTVTAMQACNARYWCFCGRAGKTMICPRVPSSWMRPTTPSRSSPMKSTRSP